MAEHTNTGTIEEFKDAIRSAVYEHGHPELNEASWLHWHYRWSDGDIVAGVGSLPDGRWAAVDGGCDYTGWDCQSGIDVVIRDTYEAVVRDGVTLEWARDMGIRKEARDAE